MNGEAMSLKAKIRNLAKKKDIQIYQTGLTGTVPFNYSRHLRVPIPSQELTTNPNMSGNSAN